MANRRFTWLLRLLPGTFREEHETELVRVWSDELRDASDAARGRVWRRAVADTLRVAPREFVSAWRHHLAIAIRSLTKAPAFATAAIATLALGIGATTAMFSLINGVLLRPLPWRHAESVGLVWPITPAGDRTWLSAPELEDLRRDVRSLSGVAGMTDLRFGYRGASAAREVDALAVSHDFFRVLGVVPAAGRDFEASDDRQTSARVAIVSDTFWRRDLGADRGAIGRPIRLNDHDYIVVGVLPQRFEWLPASAVLPAYVEVWVALEPHLISRDRSVRYLHAFARLRNDATFESARAELGVYSDVTTSRFAGVYTGGRWTATIVPFKDDVLRHARPSLLALMYLVLLVLVIACANVANLLLARGVSRRTELGVKVALGAGPARLAGELMAEGVVLAASGGTLGLAIAAWLPRIVGALDPAAVPRLEHVGLDWRVVTVTATVVVLTAALSILLPFLERLRLRSTADPLRDRSAGRSRGVARAGHLLVVVQSTFATIAVVGALFLAYTFDRLQRSPLGFDPQNAVTARVTVFTPSPGRTPAQFFADAISAMSRVPGVRHAGAISQLPFSGAMLGSAFLAAPGAASAAMPQRIDIDLRAVTPGYFAAAATPVTSGRPFTDHDVAASVPVAIVDETFARALTATGTVIGRRIRWLRQPDVDVEIIGVVAAVRHRNLAEPPRPTVYRPLTQYPRSSMFLIARTSGEARAMSDRVVEAIQSAGALHPISDVATMSERVSRSTSRARLSFVFAAILAATALVLGSVGLYGVLSFDVSQRRREFGVRLALGATAARVRLLVLRDGLPLVLAGLAIGIASAWILIHTATSVLYGITPADVPPYAIGALVVALCSGTALWLPIRRASAVDPAVALRQD